MGARCGRCEGLTHTQAVERYEVKKEKLGITVYLDGKDIERRVCEECGTEWVSIPDLPGLIAAAAVARARQPWKLRADEIRFLRKALELPAKDLADLLEVTPETVSRWENDKAVIGPANEKLLRLAVGLRLGSQAPAIKFDYNEIVEMRIQSAFDPSSKPPPLSFKRVPMVTQSKEEQIAWRDDRKAA